MKFFADDSGVVSARNEQENFTPIGGGPIVLQRRGSVYGANVPMITGWLYFTRNR